MGYINQEILILKGLISLAFSSRFFASHDVILRHNNDGDK